jgi:gliding motility-associated-like protein
MFTEIAAGLTETTLTDNVVGQEDIACYQVSVSYSPENGGQDLVFRSNIVCVVPRTEVFIPNAFSPNAVQSENLTFRPRFSNLPPADGYSLNIYDRWGGLLFATEDPSAGWAGDSQGQFLPAGTYLYQLRFRNSFGETVDRAGTINLLR